MLSTTRSSSRQQIEGHMHEAKPGRFAAKERERGGGRRPRCSLRSRLQPTRRRFRRDLEYETTVSTTQSNSASFIAAKSGSRTSRSATSPVTSHPPGATRPYRSPAGVPCNGW
ncbi:hypothetical protein GCM10029978_044750 [Actinoallomurus acanthiterrae]